MSAKHKLNTAYLMLAAGLAGIVGLATGSLTAFALTLSGLVVAGFLAGDFRR